MDWECNCFSAVECEKCFANVYFLKNWETNTNKRIVEFRYYFLRKNFVESVKSLDTAILIMKMIKYPKLNRLLILRGTVYSIYEKTEEENSIKDFLESSKMNPEDPIPLFRLGLEYGKRRKFSESLKLFNDCLSLIPYNNKELTSKCYVEIGNIMAETGRLEKDEKDGEQRKTIRLKESLEKFNRAVHEGEQQLHDSSHVAYFYRGCVLSAMKKYEEAEKDFKRSLEIKPNYYKSRIAQMILLRDLKRKPKEACVILNNLIKDHPNNNDLYRHRGMCYILLEIPEEALKNFELGLAFSQNKDFESFMGKYFALLLKRYFELKSMKNDFDQTVDEFKKGRFRFDTATRFLKGLKSNLKKYGGENIGNFISKGVKMSNFEESLIRLLEEEVKEIFEECKKKHGYGENVLQFHVLGDYLFEDLIKTIKKKREEEKEEEEEGEKDEYEKKMLRVIELSVKRIPRATFIDFLPPSVLKIKSYRRWTESLMGLSLDLILQDLKYDPHEIYHKFNTSRSIVRREDGNFEQFLRRLKKVKISDLLITRKLGEGSFGTAYMCRIQGFDGVFVVKILKGGRYQDKKVLLERETCHGFFDPRPEEEEEKKKIKRRFFCENPYTDLRNIVWCVMTDEEQKVDRKGLPGYVPNRHPQEFITTRLILMRHYRKDLLKYVSQRVKNNKDKFSNLELCYILKGVLEGCNVLHEKKIVHRDLHPENVFVEELSGRIWIADFGCCCYCGDYDNFLLKGDDDQMFRPSGSSDCSFYGGYKKFLPPEVRNFDRSGDKFVDYEKCDIFSIGMIGYFLVSAFYFEKLEGGYKYKNPYGDDGVYIDLEVGSCDEEISKIIEGMLRNGKKERIGISQSIKRINILIGKFENETLGKI